MNLTMEQLSVSTAEEEQNYFSGYEQTEAPKRVGSFMPTGTYRVVDGSLYLVLPSSPSPSRPRTTGQRQADY